MRGAPSVAPWRMAVPADMPFPNPTPGRHLKRPCAGARHQGNAPADVVVQSALANVLPECSTAVTCRCRSTALFAGLWWRLRSCATLQGGVNPFQPGRRQTLRIVAEPYQLLEQRQAERRE